MLSKPLLVSLRLGVFASWGSVGVVMLRYANSMMDRVTQYSFNEWLLILCTATFLVSVYWLTKQARARGSFK